MFNNNINVYTSNTLVVAINVAPNIIIYYLLGNYY